MSTFQPAVDKTGFSKLIFKGLETKSGEAPVKDKEGNIRSLASAQGILKSLN